MKRVPAPVLAVSLLALLPFFASAAAAEIEITPNTDASDITAENNRQPGPGELERLVGSWEAGRRKEE